MKRIFYLPLVLLAFSGCKKEKEVSKASKDPVVMTFDSLQEGSAMNVFTSDGALLNARTITGFLDRKYRIGSTNYISGFVAPTDSYGKDLNFTFYDSGRITFAADIINEKKDGDATIMKSTVINDIKDNSIVTSDLFKYKFDVNNNKYNYQYVVHRHDKSIDVSLLYYKLVRYNEQGELKEVAFGTVHNELNPDFVKSLTKRDTLAVKSYVIKYSVK